MTDGEYEVWQAKQQCFDTNETDASSLPVPFPWGKVLLATLLLPLVLLFLMFRVEKWLNSILKEK